MISKPTPSPAVSVCIPTRDRADELANRMSELEAQTLQDHEVVVVDDGSGHEHADRLAHRLARVRAVVQRPPRVDPVEGRVVEGQGLGIGYAQIGLQSLEGQAPARMPDGGLGQIDAGHAGARTGEPHEVRRHADADLEDGETPRSLEVRVVGDERFELVAASLDVRVPLAAALGCLSMDCLLYTSPSPR